MTVRCSSQFPGDTLSAAAAELLGMRLTAGAARLVFAFYTLGLIVTGIVAAAGVTGHVDYLFETSSRGPRSLLARSSERWLPALYSVRTQPSSERTPNGRHGSSCTSGASLFSPLVV